MKFVALCVCLSFLLQDLPLKPKEEFDIKLNYQFKQRPANNQSNTVNLDESRKDYERRTSTDLLPYLVLNIKMVKLGSEEVRVRITNNHEKKSYVKKLEEGQVVPLDLGFTDDVKDRVSPHEYILTFQSPKKSDISKIVIHIDEDGSFFVNGEKRGKF